ncbi:mechanosensitive ion channel family protein [Kordiimonas pumila]|uniref:Mechanosensitive ion channel family protein n=1 Tax=Kordiimonas pumila TaxID=2161677 RepID=A0ABV7D2R9_9PROT|nr:mechanosensitive ion channel domain-containing protein [Kordiimonas pumila]
MTDQPITAADYINTAKDQAEAMAVHMLDRLTHTDTYFYLAVLVIIITCSLIAQIFIHNRFVKRLKSNRKILKSFRQLMPKIVSLTAPVATLVLLIPATALSAALYGSTEVMAAAARLATIWLIWAALWALVDSALLKILSIWVLLPATFLHIFNELDTAIAILETVSFNLGKVEITAYTIVKAVVFFSIVMWAGQLMSNLGTDYIRRTRSLTISTKELLIKLFDIGLYILLFIVALDLIGIDLTALTVFSGALGVGLGFGLQKIASNFISGIILLTEKSVTIGNLVEMDNGTFGYMRKLGARASVIETFDGKEVMVPNEDFITSRVANLTHSSNVGRIEVPVGVAYGSDLEAAQKLILRAAETYTRTSKNENYKPDCFLRCFNDSSIDFLLVFWIDDVREGRWKAQSDVMLTVWSNLRDGGIEIPFPQRDLHIKSGVPELTEHKEEKPARKTENKSDPETEAA